LKSLTSWHVLPGPEIGPQPHFREWGWASGQRKAQLATTHKADGWLAAYRGRGEPGPRVERRQGAKRGLDLETVERRAEAGMFAPPNET
jgi:hypothetical protein